MKRNELIIELPHLQTLPQRIGSAVVATACWLLWIYFLFPLVSLSGWLLGVRKFSAEVRWFGGYKSLIELLQIYGLTVLAILAVWLLVTFFRGRVTHRRNRPPRAQAGTQHARFVHASTDLSKASAQRGFTVHFDEHGIITELTPLPEKSPEP